MKSTYNEMWLHNLHVMKEAKQWQRQRMISSEQFTSIAAAYTSDFYHPNVIIRILLFIASVVALSGLGGILALFIYSADQNVISILCLFYGIGSFFFLEKVFIRKNHHYKSGVTEALLYHAMGFFIGGVVGLTDFNPTVTFITCILVFSFAAIRYIDLISTLAALCAVGGWIFYIMYESGAVMQQLIPFVFIILFTALYFYFKSLKKHTGTALWLSCLILSESLCLLVIYAAGNYLVVRELSEEMLNLYLEPGRDIPYAFIFYFLTIIIPIIYLYVGIKNKDVILLRVSLLVLAFCVFTFKYYYSTGHHEITLTFGGAFLLLITLVLFRYLKIPRHGFTRENILHEKWSDMNVSAFIVSQTMGGNQVTTEDSFEMGGGSSGGGGSGGEF